MAKIPIGLQLYSVRHDAEKDLPGVLKQVAGMGYEGVEFAGYYGHSAEDIRKMLDDNGLKCCGGHLGLNTLLGDELDKTVAFQETLGNDFLIVPGLPGDRTSSPAAWRETAKVFNDISAKLRPLGKWTGYHNHHTEFTPMDGELPWDIFFSNTVKDVVMQLDSGNAYFGGAQILPFIERYPGRALTVHLKPYSKKAAEADPHAGFRPIIGDDDLPWDELFKACETVGATQWYIVEYESDLHPPLEAVDRCLKALRAMGK